VKQNLHVHAMNCRYYPFPQNDGSATYKPSALNK